MYNAHLSFWLEFQIDYYFEMFKKNLLLCNRLSWMSMREKEIWAAWRIFRRGKSIKVNRKMSECYKSPKFIQFEDFSKSIKEDFLEGTYTSFKRPYSECLSVIALLVFKLACWILVIYYIKRGLFQQKLAPL